jgi:hypothetical protein
LVDEELGFHCASTVLLLFVIICIKLYVSDIAGNDPQLGECFCNQHILAFYQSGASGNNWT